MVRLNKSLDISALVTKTKPAYRSETTEIRNHKSRSEEKRRNCKDIRL